MKPHFFAGAALTALLVAGAAQAQTPPASAPVAQPAPQGQRCDRDGCWTYSCDATSNHCHRHWTASSPRGMPMMGAAPPRHRPDQLCDIDGDNCTDETAPPG
ncbi:MAG TPA: hypothetical protein VGF56_00520 [Rhizomicrobium sp.]|jgi:hypothetical protein